MFDVVKTGYICRLIQLSMVNCVFNKLALAKLGKLTSVQPCVLFKKIPECGLRNEVQSNVNFYITLELFDFISYILKYFLKSTPGCIFTKITLG